MAESLTFQPLPKVPEHLAIIMDGNGRWAQARGLARNAGHQAGRDNAQKIIQACADLGIRYLTIYAFSTENWKRPLAEVKGLMNLFENATDRDIQQLDDNDVRVRHLGRTDGLSAILRRKIQRSVDMTKDNSRITVNIALNYGGRAEIVDAVREIVRSGIAPEAINEETISAHLGTANIPDPDLVIRTGGEMRLSNFLVWQAAYAEYYVTDTYWPDFDAQELYRALQDYGKRKRRFGQLDWQVDAEQQ